MKKIEKPNVDCRVLESHDIFMNVNDSLGRNWKFSAWPKNSGSVCFFNCLSEMRNWEREVIDIREMFAGRLAMNEKLFNVKIESDFYFGSK